ncbi:hypothetical protein, partial [Stenotrophomonas maltophilia]|uniref:hypothetical protein n=1 Tax=Stenotrophomonas maltophilia TaxID=40324 RepID=UPI00313CCDA0
RMQAGVGQGGPNEMAAAFDGGRAILIEFDLGRLLGEITPTAVVFFGEFQGTAEDRGQMQHGIVVAHLRDLRTRGR